MNQYEAMFLFDPTFGSTFENCEAEIQRLLERAEAQIDFLRRWDERRLAYRIKGRKRGVYVLVYFKANGEKIVPLERDAQLSENILRLLVLRADGITPELMEKGASLRTATADDEDTRSGPVVASSVGKESEDSKEPEESEEQAPSETVAAREGVEREPLAGEVLASNAPLTGADDEPADEIS